MFIYSDDMLKILSDAIFFQGIFKNTKTWCNKWMIVSNNWMFVSSFLYYMTLPRCLLMMYTEFKFDLLISKILCEIFHFLFDFFIYLWLHIVNQTFFLFSNQFIFILRNHREVVWYVFIFHNVSNASIFSC